MKVFIIAEAGVNHNGCLKLAKKLVDAAVEAKVNCIKFQTFISEELVTKEAQKAQYQKDNHISNSSSQLEMLKKLELSQNEHYELFTYCNKNNIQFLSTPFDLKSIDFLYSLKLGIWKISSGDITNYPFLKKIGSYNQKIILSTGMANIDEINEALKILVCGGTEKEKISLLHCTTEYPTPFSEVNLMAMQTLKNIFNINIGYSDHTLGIEIPIAAVALGAKIIEKHFTLDRKMEGPDHKASLEPFELKEMVKCIRNVEKSIGDGIKKPTKSELKNIPIVRKSIHISKNILKDHIIEHNDLIMKRPGDGISPMNYEKIVGKAVVKDLYINHKLTWEDLA